MIRNRTTGEPLLKFDLQINKAAAEGENDLALELVRDQRDWYEYFGLGDAEEMEEYWRRKNARR